MSLTLTGSPQCDLFLHPVQHMYQGNTNGCGTTALAMVLNSLAANLEVAYTRETLDAGYRPFDLFSAPGMLARLAREKGFYAGVYHQASFEQIRKHLQQGNLILSLHQPVKGLLNSLYWHWNVIHGYEETGQKLIITDPGVCDPKKAHFRIPFQEACEKHSATLKFGPIPTGVDRMILVVSSQNHLPPDSPMPFVIRMANAINMLGNWVAGLLR